MRISFVIPAHNEAGCIGGCLRSVLRAIEASRCDAEVIVVNNASTDLTGSVASAFTGVRVIEEPRKGVTIARQRGFGESRGDIVACIDADTVLPRGWIETVLGEFARRRNLVCLSGPYVYRDLPEVTRIGVLAWYAVAAVLYGLLNQYVLRGGAMLQGGNHAVRRSALEKVGGYNTAIAFHGDDTDTGCRLLRVGAVRFSFRLRIYTSGRRLRQEGVLRTAWTYALNSLFVILYHRALARSYTDVRE